MGLLNEPDKMFRKGGEEDVAKNFTMGFRASRCHYRLSVGRAFNPQRVFIFYQ